MDNDIVVDYSNFHITINGKSVIDVTTSIRDILTGDLFRSLNKKEVEQHIIQQQQLLNYLDSIKDGAKKVVLKQLNMYPLSTAYGEPSFPNTLHNIENKIKEKVKPYIHQITWTKLKKRSALNHKLSIDHIFRDSGIGADVFIEGNITQRRNEGGFHLYNNFATYMDPATRGPPSKVWPEPKRTIRFGKNFMNLFGLEESSLSATTKNMTNFNYHLLCNNQIFQHNGVGTDTNLNLFAGNNSKNKILKGTGNTDHKIALIALKEWGDKMQVLFLLIWKFLNKNVTYTLITCDKVVYTLCLLLDIKCILTAEIKTKEGRQYSIEIFEPSNDPISDAKKRFDNIKKEILDENKSFILRMQYLKKNNTVPIKIDGISEEVAFKSEFYNNILKDIQTIQDELTNINLQLNRNESNPISVIESKIKDLKLNYLLNHFIKKTVNKIKMTMTKQYTFNSTKKSNFGKDFDDTPFYLIGKVHYSHSLQKPNSFLTHITRPSQSTSRIRKPNPKFRTGGVSSGLGTQKNKGYQIGIVDKKNNKHNFNMLLLAFEGSEFDMTPIFYDDVRHISDTNNTEYVYETVQEHIHIDLNKTLVQQVEDILKLKNREQYFDSFFSFVLMQSYINNGIPLDFDPKNPSNDSSLLNIMNLIELQHLSLPTDNQLNIPTISSIYPQQSSFINTPAETMQLSTYGGKKQKNKRSRKLRYKKSKSSRNKNEKNKK